MKIIHSGFDTITFAVKGALSPNAREHIEHTRLCAQKEGAVRSLEYLEDKLHANIHPNGQRGGYAYVIDTGPIGEIFFSKIILAYLNGMGW